MSTEEGEAGPACEEATGGTTGTHRRTWEEGEPHGSQGRPRPDDEHEAQHGDAHEEGGSCRGDGHAFGGDAENNGGNFSSEEGAVGGTSCKSQAMHSNCSSETCIPTPSCRICFQGAEQVSAQSHNEQAALGCSWLCVHNDMGLTEVKGNGGEGSLCWSLIGSNSVK